MRYLLLGLLCLSLAFAEEQSAPKGLGNATVTDTNIAKNETVDAATLAKNDTIENTTVPAEARAHNETSPALGNTTEAVANATATNVTAALLDTNKTVHANMTKRTMMGYNHDCLEGPCIDAEPGYYSQECHAQKKCADPKKFCHMYTCTDCLKNNIVCTNNGQCCDGSICIYGRCAPGSKNSKVPGKFCDRQDDCHESHCCVHEHEINPIIKICKPKLGKHQTCGPHNQFHQSEEHGAVDAACEPCKGKLQCKQVGLFGVHEICLDP